MSSAAVNRTDQIFQHRTHAAFQHRTHAAPKRPFFMGNSNGTNPALIRRREGFMRTDVLATVVLLALPSAVQRGVITGVNASPVSGPGFSVAITVAGENPCGAVRIDYGDGNVVTHPIQKVPATIQYRYAQADTYRVRAEGMGNCDGQAATTLRLTAQPGAQPAAPSSNDVRFRAMDANGDGVITRPEWRGSAQSFRVHDWNDDGVLSGDEVRTGERRAQRDQEDFEHDKSSVLRDWTERRFADLDHNGDGRIARSEWHYEPEQFNRVDRNRDGMLSKGEFLGEQTGDDDRDDRFRDLDANGSGRIERDEWHGSRDAFESLDRNNDGGLSRAEVVGSDRAQDRFASLDVNRDRIISPNEWHWSRSSFEQRDSDHDGVLTRREFEATASTPAPTSGRAIVVDSKRQWTDTGIFVRAGDRVTFTATGSVQLSADGADLADPRGSRTGRRAPNGPLPQDPAGGLIARIGDSGPLYIGDRVGAVRVPRDGQLYLGVNDDHFPDNSGEFRVTVDIDRR
jgi:Ca2+-binding EF-hand superfamily protein